MSTNKFMKNKKSGRGLLFERSKIRRDSEQIASIRSQFFEKHYLSLSVFENLGMRKFHFVDVENIGDFLALTAFENVFLEEKMDFFGFRGKFWSAKYLADT